MGDVGEVGPGCHRIRVGELGEHCVAGRAARAHLEIVLIELAHEVGEGLGPRDAHDALDEHLVEGGHAFLNEGRAARVGHDEGEHALDALARRLTDDGLDRALRGQVDEHRAVDQRDRWGGHFVEEPGDVATVVEVDGHRARLERAGKRRGRAARARKALDRAVVGGEVEVGVPEDELGAVVDGGELAAAVADRRDPPSERRCREPDHHRRVDVDEPGAVLREELERLLDVRQEIAVTVQHRDERSVVRRDAAACRRSHGPTTAA